jgi:bacteriochlorophyllide a dehydrogenase
MLIRTAQAIVVSGPQQLNFIDVRLQDLSADEVLIKTEFTSISAGTERLLLAGHLVKMAGLPFPCIPGYETVGEVIEVGSNVSPHFIGQKVFVGGSYGYVDGITPAWGGQSSYITADYRKVFVLTELNRMDAVAIAPAATAWHGVEIINPQPGEVVIVLGQGPIGQFAAQAAKMRGAFVAVADVEQSRLDNALVGDMKVNVSQEVIKDKLPRKADILIDATGKMDAIHQNITALRERARVLLLGFYRRIEMDFAWPFLKELSFHISREWASEDIPAVMKGMTEGWLRSSHLFTHRLPITGYQEAYELALNDPNCVKVLLEWENLNQNKISMQKAKLKF